MCYARNTLASLAFCLRAVLRVGGGSPAPEPPRPTASASPCRRRPRRYRLRNVRRAAVAFSLRHPALCYAQCYALLWVRMGGAPSSAGGFPEPPAACGCAAPALCYALRGRKILSALEPSFAESGSSHIGVVWSVGLFVADAPLPLSGSCAWRATRRAIRHAVSGCGGPTLPPLPLFGSRYARHIGVRFAPSFFSATALSRGGAGLS